jgi:hypothetical protein
MIIIINDNNNHYQLCRSLTYKNLTLFITLKLNSCINY